MSFLARAVMRLVDRTAPTARLAIDVLHDDPEGWVHLGGYYQHTSGLTVKLLRLAKTADLDEEIVGYVNSRPLTIFAGRVVYAALQRMLYVEGKRRAEEATLNRLLGPDA